MSEESRIKNSVLINFLLRWGLIILGWFLGAWIGINIAFAVFTGVTGYSAQELIFNPDMLLAILYPLISIPSSLFTVFVGAFTKRPAQSFVVALLTSAITNFILEGLLLNLY